MLANLHIIQTIIMSTQLKQYEQAREALIRSDLAMRRDRAMVDNSLSDSYAAKADAVLRRIRQEEADTVWKQEYPNIPHPFPGMEFLTGMFAQISSNQQHQCP